MKKRKRKNEKVKRKEQRKMARKNLLISGLKVG